MKKITPVDDSRADRLAAKRILGERPRGAGVR